jgi:hypothetical protein
MPSSVRFIAREWKIWLRALPIGIVLSGFTGGVVINGRRSDCLGISSVFICFEGSLDDLFTVGRVFSCTYGELDNVVQLNLILDHIYISYINITYIISHHRQSCVRRRGELSLRTSRPRTSEDVSRPFEGVAHLAPSVSSHSRLLWRRA